MDLYREEILDHYRNPRNEGTLPHPDRQAHGANPLCGDAVAIDVKLRGETITEVKFHGEGCAISLAAASMLTDAVKGKRLSEIPTLGKEFMLGLLKIELSPSRLKCGLLPLEVLQDAVK